MEEMFNLSCPHNDNKACDYCNIVHAQDGWKFKGCFCDPNKGKFITSSIKCPLK